MERRVLWTLALAADIPVGPTQTFTTIAAGVGAAASDDVLRIDPGLYTPPSIDLGGTNLIELQTGRMGSPHPVERTPIRNLPRMDVRLAFVRDLYDEDRDKTFVGGMSPFAEIASR